jgi:ATP-dependent helicase HrpA
VDLRLFQGLEEARRTHLKGVQALLTLRLGRDLKFLNRNLTLPREASRGAGLFGGAAAVEKAMHQTLLNELLQRNIRTREEFEAHVKTATTSMFEQGQRFRVQVGKVLAAYDHALEALRQVRRSRGANEETLAICGRIQAEIEGLVPRNFLEIHSLGDLLHIPRYLKAMQVRAERAANDPSKDRSRAARAEIFVEAYQGLTANLSPHASQRKREALEAFRWMVEEFKVSLFAQELKTRYPVSEKRLEEKRREIERML